MNPIKSFGNTSASSRERGANSDFESAVRGRDQLVVDAVVYAIENRHEYGASVAAKVVAEQAELEAPAIEQEIEVISLDSERERRTAEARRLVDELDDTQEEAA